MSGGAAASLRNAEGGGGAAGRPVRLRSAILVQVVLLSILVWAVRSHWLALEAPAVLPALRETPLVVTSRRDEPAVVSDEQLDAVLSRVRLRDEGARTRVAQIDHSLRLWGRQASFAEPEVFSGAALYGVLTDHAEFLERYGSGQPALLSWSEGGRGVRARVGTGSGGAAHTDHLLATLLEIETPLDAPLVTVDGPAELADLARQSLADFSLNQAEYEWSLLSQSLLLSTATPWMTRERQRVSFDSMAERAMREPLPSGVCSGQHRLYALAVLLRVHAALLEAEGRPILSERVAKRVSEFLVDATALLVARQDVAGYWDRGWSRPVESGSDAPPATGSGATGQLSDRLLVTGHALEWWALAPPETLPPAAVSIRAGQWLVGAIAGLDDAALQRNHSYLTHAARALALWRGRAPHRGLSARLPPPPSEAR